jgi:MFS family permease
VRFRGPLADSYPGAVALVLLALTPYLALTTALLPLQRLIAEDLGMSTRSLTLGSGMANAAYAVGAVLAVQLASRLRPRRLLLIYALLFVAGSALAAGARTPGAFIAGHVMQGLATGLLLIASVPPLVLNWGRDELPRTAVAMNLGIFGAVAAGPAAGGLVAGSGHWRALLWVVAALGAGAFAFALLTYEDAEPQDPDAPVDVVALLLATAGCACTFFGVSELMDRRATDPVVAAPVLAGLLLLGALVVHEWRTEDPLIPVRKLAHTIPLAAIVVAMSAGAASVAVVQLTQTALQLKGASPSHAGLLFIPEIVMALAVAILFGRLLYTRWTAVLALTGLLTLAIGCAVLSGAVHSADGLVLAGTALAGFGVGASVSPALFLTGFSLVSDNLPRVFAFVELLRGVAAFLIAPVLVEFATTRPDQTAGLRTATWIVVAIVVAGLVAALTIGVLGGARLREPDVDTWLAGDGPAIPSEPIGAALGQVTRAGG